MMKNQKGFTLIELVVAIAIIGILAGIAIPRFLDAQASAKGAKVIANLRTIDSASSIYMAKYGSIPASIDDLTTGQSKFLEPLRNYTSGTFTIMQNDGSVATYDNVSGAYALNAEGRAVLGGDTNTVDYFLGFNKKSIGTMSSNMTTIIDAMKGQHVSDLNSGAASNPNSHVAQMLTVLADTGIDLEALGATSWRYDSKGNGFLYWSTIDISSVAPGSYVPVIRYNNQSGNYVVVSLEVINQGGYNILNSGKSKNYTPSTSTATNGNQTFEKAQEYYNALLASL